MVEKENERRVGKIEQKIGAGNTEDSEPIDYGTYVRACKQIFKEIKEGKNLEEILARSTYSENLKTGLRKSVPGLIEKLKLEKLWSEKANAK